MMSSPRDDRNRTQIPRLPSSCFLLIVLLSTHAKAPSVKGWRREWTNEPSRRGGDRTEKSPGTTLWHFPLFWLRTMKAAATTTPGDQELELGTACCANSLFLILGLSFSPSPFRAAPPLSPPPCACIPGSGSAPHFPAGVPRGRVSCWSPAPLGGQGAPSSKKQVLVKRSVFQLLET